MSSCRSCGADVVFVPSAKSGKPMILDAKSEKRVIVTTPIDDFEEPVTIVEADFPRAVARVVTTYVDHHVTCPAAASWKGRTRRG